MRTLKIVIGDSLPYSSVKTAQSRIRGMAKIEVADYSDEIDKKEYEQLKKVFFDSSKRSMSQHISKFTE
jgi:hypothetical protein